MSAKPFSAFLFKMAMMPIWSIGFRFVMDRGGFKLKIQEYGLSGLGHQEKLGLGMQLVIFVNVIIKTSPQ